MATNYFIQFKYKKLKLLPNFFIEILLSYWCSIPLLSHANNMKLIVHIIHSKQG